MLLVILQHPNFQLLLFNTDNKSLPQIMICHNVTRWNKYLLKQTHLNNGKNKKSKLILPLFITDIIWANAQTKIYYCYGSLYDFFFKIMNVQTNLRASQLIPQNLKVYSQILTSVIMKGIELVTNEKQT